MKVTGEQKIELGDVLHLYDGTKRIVTTPQGEPGSVVGECAWFLLSPGIVKKITRKAKERELGPDELMQVGDIVRFASGSELTVERHAGRSVSSLASFPTCKVFRPLNPARISRREYKRRIKAAIEYIKTADEALVSRKLVEILEGKR